MNNRVVNMRRLEAEIAGDDMLGDDPLGPLRRSEPQDFAPLSVRQAPLPDYVTHHEGVTALGVISAEAVVHQWEIAAKSIEAMGEDMRQIATRCQALMTDAHAAVGFIDETAAYYRAQGAKVFSEVEAHALVVEEVRKTCEDIRQKIAGQTSSA